jgi:hypothetical protein
LANVLDRFAEAFHQEVQTLTPNLITDHLTAGVGLANPATTGT